MGISEVTFYAFSIENFKRDEYEVNGLMRMAEIKFEKLLLEKLILWLLLKIKFFLFRKALAAKGICFRFFGDTSLLSEKIQILIAKIEIFTRHFKK